jgi:hypothetical protein
MGFDPEWPSVEVVKKCEEEDENKSLEAEAEIELALIAKVGISRV